MASVDLWQYVILEFITIPQFKISRAVEFQLTKRGFGYDSTDCAAVRHRVQEEKAQRVIYVIDNGQDTEQSMFLCWGWREEAGSYATSLVKILNRSIRNQISGIAKQMGVLWCASDFQHLEAFVRIYCLLAGMISLETLAQGAPYAHGLQRSGESWMAGGWPETPGFHGLWFGARSRWIPSTQGTVSTWRSHPLQVADWMLHSYKMRATLEIRRRRVNTWQKYSARRYVCRRGFLNVKVRVFPQVLHIPVLAHPWVYKCICCACFCIIEFLCVAQERSLRPARATWCGCEISSMKLPRDQRLNCVTWRW